MPNTPKVAIVTPIYNGIEHTLKYLASINEQTYQNIDVYIIDDGSTDDSTALIKRNFPTVKILHGDGNLWWSGATNLGAKQALQDGADFILTMNNDVELDPACVAESVNCIHDQPRSLVGSKVYYASDRSKVWFFGARFDPHNADILPIGGRDEDFPDVIETDMLTGMGILIPAQVFQDIGLFDNVNFPQYYGDSDFSLRAKEKGYKLLVTPRSKVFADVGSSWISRQKSINLKFFITALFSIRSQFNIKIRVKFYQRHGKKGWQISLLKFYIWFFKHYIKVFIKGLLRK
jgi:GT2 family glycosyltransferase